MMGYGLASTNDTCDITLKHAPLSKLNMRQNPAPKSRQISSDSLDITMLPEPWIISINHDSLIFGFCHMISQLANPLIMID